METKVVCSDPVEEFPPSAPQDDKYDDHIQEHSSATCLSPEVIARVEAGEDPMFDANWNQRSWKDYSRRMVPIWRKEVLPAYDRYCNRSRTDPYFELLTTILQSIWKYWFKR